MSLDAHCCTSHLIFSSTNTSADEPPRKALKSGQMHKPSPPATLS